MVNGVLEYNVLQTERPKGIIAASVAIMKYSVTRYICDNSGISHLAQIKTTLNETTLPNTQPKFANMVNEVKQN